MEKSGESAYTQAIYSTWQELGKTPKMVDSLLASGLGSAALVHYLDLCYLNAWEKATSKRYDKSSWVDFMRKAGVNISIKEGEVDLTEQEIALKMKEDLSPGNYEAVKDDRFDEWIQRQSDKVIQSIERQQ